jgi:hypothetical protein
MSVVMTLRRVVSGRALSLGMRGGVVAPTAAAQRAALVDLYLATNGSGWSTNTGWVDYSSEVGNDPCDDSWAGLICSGSTGSSDRSVYVSCRERF